MRKVSALTASKAFKVYMQKNGNSPLSQQDFVEFMISIMKKYDFCDTKSEEDIIRDEFDKVFSTFDYDKSGNLDAEEVANCLSLMCGGSINHKIYAAFTLFDDNNSMTLSFDELNKFIRCVFQTFDGLRKGNSALEGGEVWNKIDIKKLTLAATEKCFQDMKLVKGKGEVNYTQFMSWMTG